MRRTFWQVDLSADYDDNGKPTPFEQVEYEDANVVSSLTEDGMHAPALDLDVPATLVESSTPGHSHLYIDVPMDWTDYVRLLDVLADVGVLEEGFVQMAKHREMTRLRKPGVTKEAA